MPREYPSDFEVALAAIGISKMLDGMPLGQALRVLAEAKTVLLDGHVVDVENGRFVDIEAEFHEARKLELHDMKKTG